MPTLHYTSAAASPCGLQLLDTLAGSLVFVVDARLHVTCVGGALRPLLPPLPAGDSVPLRAWLPSALVDATLPHLQAALAGECHTFDLTLGGDVWLQATAAPLDGALGARSVQVAAFDITAHKRTEASQAAEIERLTAAVEAAHMGTWDWDLRTNQVAFSREWKRQLGLAPEEISTDYTEWLSRVHPDDVERTLQVVEEALASGSRHYSLEFRLRHKDGSYRHIWGKSLLYAYDDAGLPHKLFGTHMDITERKRAEAAQEQQARLAAVGQLAAGIAHDFNNILSIILIYAELLSAAKGISDKGREQAETIAAQTMRATRMIRQILDFSRQSVFQRHALDLLPLLKEQVKLLKQTLPENIAVEFHYAPREYCVVADPTRMQQMVMNLALNARDAMPHGGTLRIALVHRADLAPAAPAAENGEVGAAEWVQIEVEDTGEGMSAPVQARLFEPFFTTKEPGKGVGLGLAQVHGIVAQHDGCIDVRSAPGEGTCFRVLLPARADSGQAADGGEESLRGLPCGNGQCVLLVEDDKVLRVSLAELLEGLDYEVVQAADGEDALRRLHARRTPPDLVISDVVMPRLGGVELLRALRQEGIVAPVILMSGHNTDLQSMQMHASGVGAFLHKPPPAKELAAAVARLLE